MRARDAHLRFDYLLIALSYSKHPLRTSDILQRDIVELFGPSLERRRFRDDDDSSRRHRRFPRDGTTGAERRHTSSPERRFERKRSFDASSSSRRDE